MGLSNSPRHGESTTPARNHLPGNRRGFRHAKRKRWGETGLTKKAKSGKQPDSLSLRGGGGPSTQVRGIQGVVSGGTHRYLGPVMVDNLVTSECHYVAV